MDKRGQLKISFGMIFSIVLIIIFLSLVFFGIKKFIYIQEGILTKKFVSDLNEDIEKMWRSSSGSQKLNYMLPNKAESVCFKQGEEDNPDNVYFSSGYFDSGRLVHIDYIKTLNNQDELCIPIENREVSFVIDKIYGETLVTISEEGRDITGIYGQWESEYGVENFYIGEPQNHGTYQEILNNPEFKILFNIDFEDRPYLGKYKTLSEFQEDWHTGWGGRGEELEIVEDPVDPDNKVALITFPFCDTPFKYICWDEGCYDEEGRRIYFDERPVGKDYIEKLDGVGPASGGVTLYIPLGGSYDEVNLSYNIKYEPDWAAPAGGKLPGFAISDPTTCYACEPTDCLDESGERCDNSPCDGIADDFTAKHMFFGSDSIGYYIYDADKEEAGYECGEVGGVPDSMIFDGNWHNIVLRVAMNTPDVPEGVVETWIDGENHGSKGGILFRTGYAKFGIESISFANFLGGSNSPCSEVMDRGNEACNGKLIAPYFAHGCDEENPYRTEEDEAWCQGLKVCVADLNDPCSDILRYSDGSPQDYWNNRKTEYIHFDDIIAYTYA